MNNKQKFRLTRASRGPSATVEPLVSLTVSCARLSQLCVSFFSVRCRLPVVMASISRRLDSPGDIYNLLRFTAGERGMSEVRSNKHGTVITRTRYVPAAILLCHRRAVASLCRQRESSTLRVMSSRPRTIPDSHYAPCHTLACQLRVFAGVIV